MAYRRLQGREAVRLRLPAPVRVLDRDVPLDLVRVRVRERLPRRFVLAAKIALLLYRDRVLRRVGPAYRDGDVPAGVRAVAAAVLAVGTAREFSREVSFEGLAYAVERVALELDGPVIARPSRIALVQLRVLKIGLPVVRRVLVP